MGYRKDNRKLRINREKVFWTLLILFLPVLGFLLWIVGGPRK
ncbi:PLDc N-terminal domain-containing protein [Desulfobacter hydrogenophilus]